MKSARLLPLLVLPFLFLGATCVTKVDQKGPTGPWIGEIKNDGPDVQQGGSVTGWVVDANGKRVAPFAADICPYVLLPGHKGYFESPSVLEYASVGPDLVQPFHLSEIRVAPWPFHVLGSSVSPQEDFIAADVSFRVMEVDEARDAILLRVTNDSPYSYDGLQVCAVNIGPSGEAREVARGKAFPTVLRPHFTADLTIQFDTPLEGTFEFGARPERTVSQTAERYLNSPPFHYKSWIIESEKGRELRVIGEVTNTSGDNLQYAVFEAYLESSPIERVRGRIDSGYGVIKAGEKALVDFSLPLGDQDSDVVKLVGVEGSVDPNELLRVPVQNIVGKTHGREEEVSATLLNPADQWLHIDSLCFEARDRHGDLLGDLCLFSPPWIQPHGSFDISWGFSLIGINEVARVQVVGYGHLGPAPQLHPTVEPPGES